MIHDSTHPSALAATRVDAKSITAEILRLKFSSKKKLQTAFFLASCLLLSKKASNCLFLLRLPQLSANAVSTNLYCSAISAEQMKDDQFNQLCLSGLCQKNLIVCGENQHFAQTKSIPGAPMGKVSRKILESS